MGGGWSSSRAAAFRRSLAETSDDGREAPADRTPDDRTPDDRAPDDRALDDRAGAPHRGPGRAGQDRSGEDRAGEGRAGADGAGHRTSRSTHCWVLMPDADPMPGVVAGWRRDGAGAWEARVAYALGDDGASGAPGTAGVVTGWLPASCLRPYRG